MEEVKTSFGVAEGQKEDMNQRLAWPSKQYWMTNYRLSKISNRILYYAQTNWKGYYKTPSTGLFL